jgi:hypothetical protein
VSTSKPSTQNAFAAGSASSNAMLEFWCASCGVKGVKSTSSTRKARPLTPQLAQKQLSPGFKRSRAMLEGVPSGFFGPNNGRQTLYVQENNIPEFPSANRKSKLGIA